MSQQVYSNTTLVEHPWPSNRATMDRLTGSGFAGVHPPRSTTMSAGPSMPAQSISNVPARLHKEPTTKERVLELVRKLVQGKSGIKKIFVSSSGERFWLVGPTWTDELDLLGARVALQVQDLVAPSRTPLILGGFVEVVDPSFSSFECIDNEP